MSADRDTTGLAIYGYSVAWVPNADSKWTMEQDDEYQNLPAHYMSLDEAIDRVAYLKGKGFTARALALLAISDDTFEEFEAAKVKQPE